jgi:hypothetical protein
MARHNQPSRFATDPDLFDDDAPTPVYRSTPEKTFVDKVVITHCYRVIFAIRLNRSQQDARFIINPD